MKTYKGLDAVVLENDFLKLIFLPQYACKLASLVSKKTLREFLFQSSSNQLIIPPYAAPFNRYDSSGFDEVFPSIDASVYPSGKFRGTEIADHGELWTLPWKTTFTNQIIFTKTQGKILPYIFSKEITLHQNKIKIHYEVENTSSENFYFIWTPHCLLNCSEFTKILVPESLNEVITVEHTTKHLGTWGTIHHYPKTIDAQGNTFDLSKTEPITAKNCEKFYFTQQNTLGWCGILHTDTNEQLKYIYDADKVPYLGIWKTHGGYRGDYNIALEPCTGVYDDLYVAYKIKKASIVPPLGKYIWNFMIEID